MIGVAFEEVSMSTFPVSIAESEEEQVWELAQMMIRQRAALVGPGDQRHEIPDSVYRLLLNVLKIMQEGIAVSIVPQMQELSTQRAANLLHLRNDRHCYTFLHDFQNVK